MRVDDRHWNWITEPKKKDSAWYIKKKLVYWTEFMTRGKENKWKNDTKYIYLNVFLCFVFIDGVFFFFFYRLFRLAFYTLSCLLVTYTLNVELLNKFFYSFFIYYYCVIILSICIFTLVLMDCSFLFSFFLTDPTGGRCYYCCSWFKLVSFWCSRHS